jgi:hypothetical protein
MTIIEEPKVQHKTWAFVLYIISTLTITTTFVMHTKGNILPRDAWASAVSGLVGVVLLTLLSGTAVWFATTKYLYFVHLSICLVGYALPFYTTGAIIVVALGTALLVTLALLFYFFSRHLIPFEGPIMQSSFKQVLRCYVGYGVVLLSLWSFLAFQGLLLITYFKRKPVAIDYLFYILLFISFLWTVSNFSQMAQVFVTSLFYYRVTSPPHSRPTLKAISDVYYLMGSISHYSMIYPIIFLIWPFSGWSEGEEEGTRPFNRDISLPVRWAVTTLRRLCPSAKRIAEMDAVLAFPIMILSSEDYVGAAEESNGIVEEEKCWDFTFLCSQSIFVLAHLFFLVGLVGWVDYKFIIANENMSGAGDYAIHVALWMLAAVLYYLFLKTFDSCMTAAVYLHIADPDGVKLADPELHDCLKAAYDGSKNAFAREGSRDRTS